MVNLQPSLFGALRLLCNAYYFSIKRMRLIIRFYSSNISVVPLSLWWAYPSWPSQFLAVSSDIDILFWISITDQINTRVYCTILISKSLWHLHNRLFSNWSSLDWCCQTVCKQGIYKHTAHFEWCSLLQHNCYRVRGSLHLWQWFSAQWCSNKSVPE